MSRYIKDMELQLPETDVQSIIDKFLEVGGFYKGEWQGKPCYVADYGMNGLGGTYPIEKIYFFDYTYINGILHFEAWVRDGKKNEIGLTGMYNFMMKQPYTELVTRLEHGLISQLPEGSEQRTRLESESKKINNNSRRMNKGSQVIYAVAVIFIIMALLNVLGHMGILF